MVHEWALAEAIADYVEKHLREAGGLAVRRISVKLGQLQAIDREILRFSLNEILRDKGLSVAEIEFLDEAAAFQCRRCGHEWRLEEVGLDDNVREAIHFLPEAVHSFVKCPRCGSRDFSVVRGRGVYIERIEVV